jgi:uncharacterized protein YfiM (DUF2279 family)
MRQIISVFIVFTISLIGTTSVAEKADSSVNKGRLRTVLIGTGAAYGASLIALNNAWYKEDRTSFHFFNDCAQWNQVDKFGHFFSAYQLSRAGKELFLWTNMSEKKSAIWGTVMSQVFMTTIDVFDGFSSEYGFSWCDISANLLGGGLFLVQELGWREQKIKTKFSFHTTKYASLRPEALGDGILEQILKDYNGHTTWFSFDIYSLSGKNTKFPRWLNFAMGYGAEGMVYGREEQNNANGYQSYRQFYAGIDFDLSYIHTKSKFLKGVLFVADMVKLPAPALEFNTKNGFNYHWLFF